MVAKTNSLHNRSTVPSYEFSLRDADIARNTTHVDKNRLSPNSFDAFVPRFFAQVAAGGHRGWDSCTRNSDFFTNGVDFFATGLDFFTYRLDFLLQKSTSLLKELISLLQKWIPVLKASISLLRNRFSLLGLDFFTAGVDSCTGRVVCFTKGVDFFNQFPCYRSRLFDRSIRFLHPTHRLLDRMSWYLYYRNFCLRKALISLLKEWNSTSLLEASYS